MSAPTVNVPAVSDPVSGYCDAVFDHCVAAPGIEDSDGSTRISSRCFACGLHACGACTLRVRWHGFGRRRVCVNCLIDDGQGNKVANLLWRQAGNTGRAPDRIVAAFQK